MTTKSIFFLLFCIFLIYVNAVPPTLTKLRPQWGRIGTQVYVDGSNFGALQPDVYSNGTKGVSSNYGDTVKMFTMFGSPAVGDKEWLIQFANPSNEKSNSLTFYYAKFLFNKFYQVNNVVYLFGENLDRIPRSDLLTVTNEAIMGTFYSTTYYNSTTMSFNLNLALSRQQFLIYDSDAGRSEGGYDFNYSPVISSYSFASGELTINGYLYLSTTQIYINSNSCPVTSQTETTIKCSPSPTFFQSPNFDLTVQHANGQKTTLPISLTTLKGFANLPDRKAATPALLSTSYNPIFSTYSRGPYMVPSTITLTGSGFVSFNPYVSIGGIECTDVVVLSSNSMTCLFSGNIPTVNFQQSIPMVYSIDLTYNATGYFYFNRPAIVVDTVSSTYYNQPGIVTIKGNYLFGTTVKVTIGGVDCTSATSSSDGRGITCDFPSTYTPSDWVTKIRVQIAIDISNSWSGNSFLYNRYTPVITSASSTTYGVSGQVTIIGSNFKPSTNWLVYIAGAQCTSVIAVSDTQLQCTFASNVPVMSSTFVYSTPLEVKVLLDATVTGTNSVFTYLRPNPTLTTASSTTRGTPGTVTIAGKNFYPSSSVLVTIGGATCASPVVNSDTQIVCTFSNELVVTDYYASIPVMVNVNGYSSTASIFKFIRPSPILTSASSTTYGTPGQVTIVGKFFSPSTYSIEISIGGVAGNCRTPTLVSDTQLVCSYDSNVAFITDYSTPLSVKVIIDVLFSNIANLFTYIRPNPALTSTSSPTYGTASKVTITGNYFTPQTTMVITIAGGPCTMTSVTMTQIICDFSSSYPATISDYSTGLPVVVTIDTTYTSTASIFKYSRPYPLLTSASSTTYRTPGQVTIAGRYFSPSTSIYVSIGGTICSGPVINGDTEIVCTFASNIPSSITDYSTPLVVLVSVEGYQSTKPIFTYIRPNPVLTAATRLTYGRPNYYVTITGQYFQPASSVVVNIAGGDCASPTVVSDSRITCVSAANTPVIMTDYSTKFPVIVTINSDYTSRNDLFSYDRPSPVLTSASSTTQGTPGQVSIVGQFFSPASTIVVTIGGTGGSCLNPVLTGDSLIVCDWAGNFPTVISDYSVPLAVAISINSAYTATKNLFTYIRPNPLLTSSSSPTYGTTTQVTINGNYFNPSTTISVMIGGTPCTSPGKTYTQIWCNFVNNVPSIITDYSAPLDVVVTIDGGPLTSTKSMFTYTRPNPVITSASKTTFATPGKVTIVGTYFSPPNGVAVTIGGGPCANPVVTGDTQIVCDFASDVIVNNYQTPLAVKVSFSPSYSSTKSIFYYIRPTPTIASATSTNYLVPGIVTITGTFFAPDSLIVTIGGSSCASPTVAQGGNQITCQFQSNVPISDFKSALTVFVSVDTAFVASKDVFYYIRPNPIINSATSTTYDTAGIVTISGTYFASYDLIVKIGNAPCASPVVSQDTNQITCQFDSKVVPTDYKVPLDVFVGIETTFTATKA
ncbi:hypothetical protein CYY_002287, partial [Polysphondylium violaceum]